MSDFKWTKKDLLSIYDLSAEEIIHILDTAEEFKKVSQRRVKKVPALRGKTVVNFFVEPSTRTRISFELAEQRLSADIINIATESSSLKKDTYLSIKSKPAFLGGWWGFQGSGARWPGWHPGSTLLSLSKSDFGFPVLS